MKYLRDFLSRFVLSEELPIDARMVNVVYLVGFFAALTDLLIQLTLRKLNLPLILTIAAIDIAILILMFISNYFKRYKICTRIMVVVMCDILFPLAFFFLGGVESAIPAYFVLSIVIIFLLLKGLSRWIFMISHLLVIFACYFIGYRTPHIVSPLGEFEKTMDQFQSILVVGFCIGMIILFQARVSARERAKAESAIDTLNAERQTNAAVMDGNPNFSLMLNDKLEIIYCNDAMVEALGFAAQEDLKKDFFALLAESTPSAQQNGEKLIPLRERIATCIREGSVQFETELLLHEKPTTWSAVMKRVPYQGSYAVIGYIVDLSDLYSARSELIHRERLLSAVNEAAEMLIAADAEDLSLPIRTSMETIGRHIGIDRIYIWKNQYIDEKLYYVPEIVWADDSVKDIPAPQVGSGYSYIESIPQWEELFAAGECVNGPVASLSPREQAVLKAFGLKSILVTPVFLKDQFWGFVSYDDCHHEKTFSKQEENIMKSNSLLMANALSRAEMTEDLIQAREDALASANAKSDFLANMSHEIRTPLNAVIGMTSIGKAATELKRKNYCFGKIEDASAHLLGVINDILDMSKIEAGKLELSPVSFNFEKMMQRVTGVITFRVDERGQLFSVYIDKHIPENLIGDDQRLAQVVTNLLSNAVKFTPENGKISVSAHLVKEENSLCTLKIEVKDTGIGIGEEQKALLFTSFQQADSSISRNFGGTGLGLVISKQIVEMMNGEIWIESEPGKGSTFSFTVQAKRGKSERKTGLLDPSVNLQNLRLLVVDDDPHLLEYFSDIVGRFGLSCDTANSGDAAMALIAENGAYDIYFIDWKMPGMNGLELSVKVKENAAGKSIVTMISSAELNTIEKEARDAGVDKFLNKPLFPSAIADLINECLGTPPRNELQEVTIETDDFSGFCVLLAEDIEINREIVLTFLEPTKLRIDCAENGKQAVEMMNRDPDRYDMIFMDVQMPEMDGYTATRLIRQMDTAKAKSIPIIAMTANVFREDIEECLESGMNDHLGKPLDFEDVREKLRAYLSSRK